MAIKPPIPGEKKYEVNYAATAASNGAALIAVLFVPREGSPVPAPSEMFVAAGTNDSLGGMVPLPENARRMEVLADLPEPGSGILTVTVDGEVISSEPIAQDASWKFVIL